MSLVEKVQFLPFAGVSDIDEYLGFYSDIISKRFEYPDGVDLKYTTFSS